MDIAITVGTGRRFLLLLATLCGSSAWGLHSPVKNLDQIIRSLNFTPYYSRPLPEFYRPVKIAILDNGFDGHAAEIGKTLPVSVTFHAGPVARPAGQRTEKQTGRQTSRQTDKQVNQKTDHQSESKDAHGVIMAQIMTGLLTNGGRSEHLPFDLHLFETFGYSNLEAAVEDVVREKFDLVLFAQVWEYGGNGDGRGFINRLINRATEAGVIWINAAGNFGSSIFRGPVRQAQDDWVRLPAANESVRVRCQQNQNRKCLLRVVLSWNDFNDDVERGTDKDLDLVLTDDALKIIQTAGLTQTAAPLVGQAGFSKYPREIIETEVKPGVYLLRVKMRSQDWTSRDELTLAVSGDFTELLNPVRGETLLNPADNTNVISVGASDSEYSSESLSLDKPELSAPSLIQLSDQAQFKGTSTAAAIIATAAAVLRVFDPRLTKDDLIEALRSSRRTQQPNSKRPNHVPNLGAGAGAGLPLHVLHFGPTGPGCFSITTLAGEHPEHLRTLLDYYGQPVYSTAGIKIFVQTDPLQIITGLTRIRLDDMVVADQRGLTLLPRSMQRELPRGSYEVVQLPAGQRLCSSDSDGRRFPGHIDLNSTDHRSEDTYRRSNVRLP